MPRILRAVAMVAASFVASGCVDLTGIEQAFQCAFQEQPCPKRVGGGGPSSPTVTTFILGFPPEKPLETNPLGRHRGRLQVGDVVTLLLARDDSPRYAPRDTVRLVGWSVTNPEVASITAHPSGEGVLEALAPGTVWVSANGISSLWTCRLVDDLSHCTAVSAIVVVPAEP